MTRVLLTDFFWADSRLSAHRVEIRKSSRSATDPRANCPFLATLLTMWTFGAGGLSPCDALSLHEHTSHATRLRKTHPARPRLGGKPSVLGYDLACSRPSEGGDYPGTAWPRAGSRIGRQRYVRRAGAEPERLARQREPYWDRHGRHLPGRRACARDGAARSRRLSRPPGPGRLLARVGADVLPDHHNGIDYTGTGFATGASRPYAKCHRPDCIHAAAFRKTLNARSRFRLE